VHRSADLPLLHPCRRVLDVPSVTSDWFFCRSFSTEVQNICTEWDIDIRSLYTLSFDDGDPLEALAYRYLESDHNSTNGSLTTALPHLIPRLHRSYLALAPKPLSSKFAALRFNRARLQSQLFSRQLSDSSSCPACPATPETVVHLLYDCPRLLVARHHCFNSINFTNSTITTPLLLGDYSSVPKQSVPIVHRAVSSFIDSISTTCHF
jgi:hypothetical protein